MRKLVVALAVLIAGSRAMATPAPTVVDHVVIKSRDGVQLRGTYFLPGQPGPAVVLFHQCDGSGRGSWGAFPRELAAAGFHVLTFDNRGTGESQRGREAPNTILGDADAAYSWLAWQHGVDASRMAAAGSSCGVGSAANLLTLHRLKALVLISGGVASTAMSHLQKSSTVAILGIGSTGDPLTSNLADAVQASKSPVSTMKWYDGSTHGVSLFAKDRELRPAIVQWLQSVMK